MKELINVNTVAITDFKTISPTVAKVILSFTGMQNKDTIREALLAKLNHQAAPIENSFRVIKAGIAVGFLRANNEVRVIAEKELRASYRVMSSNIMMDNSDKSLWEVRNGAGGKYLARHGNEDLSELIEAATKHRQDIPGISKLALAKAARKEVVAFVSPSGDMDYGFCLASNDEKVKIYSHTSRTPMTVTYDMVTFMGQCPVPKSVNRRILEAGISRDDKAQQIEYYERLFSYAPEYMREVIEMVEQGTLA